MAGGRRKRADDSRRSTVTVDCPECGVSMEVDSTTGAVLAHHGSRRSAGKPDFDDLLAGIDDDRRRAEKVFAREKAMLEDRERLLERRFEEAMRRAEDVDDDTPPPSPFDLD